MNTGKGKLHGGLDTYLQETLGDQEKPLQKTRGRREKHRRNLGRNQAQKSPRPSYEVEKNNNNKRKYIHHIYRDKFIERRSIELSAIFEINQLI